DRVGRTVRMHDLAGAEARHRVAHEIDDRRELAPRRPRALHATAGGLTAAHDTRSSRAGPCLIDRACIMTWSLPAWASARLHRLTHSADAARHGTHDVHGEIRHFVDHEAEGPLIDDGHLAILPHPCRG